MEKNFKEIKSLIGFVLELLALIMIGVALIFIS